MSTMLRSSRAAFRFSGPDAQKLLFDVVTGRLLAQPGPAVWWALLSPQGKIQAEGLAGWADEAFWLDVDSAVADAFLKRMKLYRLRARVEIEDLRESHDVGWTEREGAAGIVHADPRGAGLGLRVVAAREQATDWLPATDLFATRRIAAGIAEQGPDYAPDTTFPHDVGMDLLEGIDFVKGCYVGQEVVSRMQHRGTARRRPVIVAGAGLARGLPVIVDGRETGTLGTPADGRALAVLRLDRISDPGLAMVEGQPVSLSLPPWATYAFGESGGAE